MSALRWGGWVLVAVALVAGLGVLVRSMPGLSHVPTPTPTAEPILLPENVGARGPTHESEPEKHSIHSHHGVHAGIMAF